MRFLLIVAMVALLVGWGAVVSPGVGQPLETPTPEPTIPPGEPVSAEQMREWYPCPYDAEEFPESCEIYAVKWLGWPGLYAVEPTPGPTPTPVLEATPAPVPTPPPTPTPAAPAQAPVAEPLVPCPCNCP